MLLLPFQVSVLGTPGPLVTPTNLLYNVVSTPGALYRYWRQGQTGGRAEQVTASLAGFSRSGEEGCPGQEAQTVRYEPYPLPSGASLTVEPGGQLELGSPPAATLGELAEVTGRDLAALRDAAAAVGLELCGYGLDPLASSFLSPLARSGRITPVISSRAALLPGLAGREPRTLRE